MSESVPISLYLDLEDGRSADLEVVARASLLWAQVVKEISLIQDPFSEIRLEIKSGTEGSLSLNILIKKISGSLKSRPNLTALGSGPIDVMRAI